jgi:oligoendopeptidase F
MNKEWNLTNLFHQNDLNYKKIAQNIQDLERRIEKLEPKNCDYTLWAEVRGELEEAFSLIVCMTSQDVSDQEAQKLEVRLGDLLAKLEGFEVKMGLALKAMQKSAFTSILDSHEKDGISFFLQELKNRAENKLSSDKEDIILQLAISGHHSIGNLYYSLMTDQEFEYQNEKLGLSQLEAHFSSHIRSERQESWKALEKQLSKKETLFAGILNSIGGFRLKVYEMRNMQLFDETLEKNRMTRETLDAMMNTISSSKKPITAFMKKKAELLGLKKLSFCDLQAPLLTLVQSIDYDKGCEIILNTFRKKTPRFAKFSENALKNGWVDAAKRGKKRAGGFCTSCPLIKESRILLTWGNNVSSLSTLAHELGHAFHNEALFEKPVFCRDISMNIAEAASTLAEMIVCDSLIASAKTKEEKLSLLDDKISRYISFMMDIHSRFIFEKSFYEKRQNGFVSADELNQLMKNAQKEGFGNALDDDLAHFWAYKMHFFFTETPFYNWPYAFGYLFSLGLYTKLQDKSDFEQRVIELLKDSGSMSMEDLAKKHLDTDLTKKDFWQDACQVLEKDIAEFIAMT